MREAFNRQLTELRQELVYIYANIDLQLHEALDALEEGNREKAKAVKAETRRLDDHCAALEQKAFMLIATQQPVASDLRLIQFVIYANFNLARMSNHVRNIAKTAKRCAGRDVPAQLIDLLVGEGHLVYGVLSNCVMAIVNEDLRLASSLPVLDEPVDDLYKQFFRRLSTLGPDDDKDAASRVIMASRMLERISDNAVEVGEKLVFLLTGKRRNLDDLQDLDDDDLAEMYAARSAGLVADKQVDEELVGQIPELKNDETAPAAKAEGETDGQ
ncbi:MULTISPECIES: PhoU domain-containing protein [unclassified Collinsella]|uniref:phosphate signaling complex PhoU family protein n=1 Tax=unclassified Collinsella TaxID=2637548 RepID=UPI00319DFF83